MNPASLRSTTAILVVLALVQPLPAFAQSASAFSSKPAPRQAHQNNRADRRTPEEVCAEAMITDAAACEQYIQQLQATPDDPSAAEAEPTVEEDSHSPVEPVADAPTTAEPEAPVAPVADAPIAAPPEAPVAPVAETPLAPEAEAPPQPAADAPTTAEPEAPVAPVADAPIAAPPEAPVAPVAETPLAPEPQVPPQPVADAPAADETDAGSNGAVTEPVAEPVADETGAEAPSQATADVAVAPAPAAEDCAAVVANSDGTMACAPAVSAGALDAIAAGTDAEAVTAVQVTNETVTEISRRASGEEFRQWSPTDRPDRQDPAASDSGRGPTALGTASGTSDLQRAGLLALGALVVGAILIDGQRVDANTGDRVVVVDRDGAYRLLKDDDALLRQPGSEVRTERYADGTTRTYVTRADGSQIITIRDSAGRALRRVHVGADGREYLLFDDTRVFVPVDVSSLPTPVYDTFDYRASTDRESLRLALLAADRAAVNGGFSLNQVREYKQVRDLAPEINLENITFATNSAAIQASQAEQLRQMGLLMRDMIRDDPTELFLVEGHTDAIGDAGYNLLLSDRRAESAALALTEYFDVPAENMVVQGYGESYPRVRTQAAEQLNRRVAIRRITALVRQP